VNLLKHTFNRKANEVSHFGAVGLGLLSDAERVRVMTFCGGSGSMMFHPTGGLILVSERSVQPVGPLGRTLVRSRGRAFGVQGEPFIGSPNSCQMVAQGVRLAANLV
jgi:hypothetical protein